MTQQAVPTHLGIIMDGNRRWAKQQGKPPLAGHEAGKQTLLEIAQVASRRGIKYLSVYAFSHENWQRSEEEVGFLMKLLTKVLKEDIEELHREQIRVRWLGSGKRLSPEIINAIKQAEALTKDNQAGTLAVCVDYGGRQEIADALSALRGEGQVGEVTPEQVAQHLYAPDIPDLDLIIRTSGEQRLSNFMLWRAAYAEFWFTEKHWPDFSEADLDQALADYAQRERRFGA